MIINTYPTLVALLLSACTVNKPCTVEGIVLEENSSSVDDTGQPLPVDDTGRDTGYDTSSFDTGDSSSFDTAFYDTGSFDTSVYDTGAHDTGSFSDVHDSDVVIETGVSRDTGVYDPVDTGSVSPSDSGVDHGSLDTGYSPEQWCTASTVPESVPFVMLLPKHYALVDSDEYFETNTGSRNTLVLEDSVYTREDTYGCSCERILDCKPSTALTGEYLYGCTEGTMKDWVAQRGWADNCSE
ncbi:MAG TPA: hypothetical protein VJJ79_03115 [Candidatus Nanoarchaeia archaeon]|nr:hypothetical protein [Candidatus Nanoarchaeia archaeon]